MARLLSSPKPRNSAGTQPAQAPAPPALAPLPTAAPAPTSQIIGAEAIPADLNPATAGQQSLLRRAAGLAGTILTSPRGVLGGALTPGTLAPRRKRLLGE